jgi:hypothetical protein
VNVVDLGGWLYGFAASSALALVLALAGAVRGWRHRDRLCGVTEVPGDLRARFLTRLGITMGLVLLTLVVAATYYGARTAGATVIGVPGSPLAWTLLAGLWTVVLWQVVRGRLVPYPGGWSGLTTLAILWIFPVGPVVLVFLTTPLGRVADGVHLPGKGVVTGLALGLLYVAVPVIAFRLRNRRRATRSATSPQLDVAATASS